jgi:RecQ mediated genome instability protein
VKQSIEYLSKKGCISTEPKALAARVYSLFLDSDLHEIASEEGILPANAQSIEFGMLCLSDDILILQVLFLNTNILFWTQCLSPEIRLKR